MRWVKVKVKGPLVGVSVVALVVLALRFTTSGRQNLPRRAAYRLTTAAPRNCSGCPTPSVTPGTETPARPGQNLNGKMFTLTHERGEISFFPPSPPFHSSDPSHTNHGSPSSTALPPLTTVSPTRGVSMCLRYITDYLTTRSTLIFTLSSSRNVLGLGVKDDRTYFLHFSTFSSDYAYFTPSIKLWPDVRSDIWTEVCITVDSRKNVAQVFSGANMSMRKLLPVKYVWSGDPVLDFSGFDGQITDVQMWDYPLRYGEVYNYMSRGVYGPYRGSVLSWSYISYSVRGNVLLEDVYESQLSVGSKGGGPLLQGETERLFRMVEEKKSI